MREAPLPHFKLFSELVLRFSGRVLAGVLHPAGQVFEKLHLLGDVDDFPKFLASFKQGASRGAASCGSDFSKITPP